MRSATDCSSDEPSQLSDADVDANTDKVYMDLKSGKLVACPFCPREKQDFSKRELLNHAIGMGAKHQMLSNLLRSDHVDAAGSLLAPHAKAPISPPKRIADDPVGRTCSELKTVFGLQVELSWKSKILKTTLTQQIAAKRKCLLALEQEIVQETDQLRKQLHEKESAIKRRKVENETKKNGGQKDSLHMARIEQRKANKGVRSLVEKHKEAALNKILVLKKQVLEMDLQQLQANLEMVKDVEELNQVEEMMNLDELQEVMEAMERLEQDARIKLAKNDGQTYPDPTEADCSNRTSAAAQVPTAKVPRGVPLTRVSFQSRVKELQGRKDWMTVVEVPESLALKDTTLDQFVVQLGNAGGGTLHQLLKCFEQLWANNMCLGGKITKENIYFVKEYGIFEVHVTPDQIFEIDEAGFKLDTEAIVEVLSVFKFNHSRYTTKQCPMYLKELITELKAAGLDPKYFRDAKKRSLLHNAAVTMTPEQRAQVYTAIVRYWHGITGKNLANFVAAMGPPRLPGNSVDRCIWLDKIKKAGSILVGRWKFNPGAYKDTYLSLSVYSRCLFEHGPTAKVSERQCEAALYLLNPKQFPHFQKQLLTVYKEIKPDVGPAVPRVARRAVLRSEETEFQGRQLQTKVDVNFRRSAAGVVPTVPIQNFTSIEDIFMKN